MKQSPRSLKDQDSTEQMSIAEAMTANANMSRVVKDVAGLKAVVSQIQDFVAKHHQQIRNELVDETQLQITVEMFKKEIEQKMAIDLNIFRGTLKQKLKKRCKLKDIECRMVGKVQYQEFMKNIEKINDNFRLFEARVTHTVNLMKLEIQKGLDRKVEIRDFEMLKKTKAEAEQVSEMTQRIADLEEFARQAQEDSDDDDSDDSEQEESKVNQSSANDGVSSLERNDTLGTKTTINKHMIKTGQIDIERWQMDDQDIKIIDDRSDHTFGATVTAEKFKLGVKMPSVVIDDDQVKFKESQSEMPQQKSPQTAKQVSTNPINKMQTAQLQPVSALTNHTKKSSINGGKSSTTGSKNPFKKKTQKKLDKMNQFMTSMFDELQRRLNENKLETIKINEIVQQLCSDVQINQKSIDTQSRVIDSIKEKQNKMEKEIERLQRLDLKLNKELVQKPYNYIDKVKEAFEKDWAETKKKFTENNDKYMGKFITLETNVNKLLTDTTQLVDNYKKKIGDIGKDLTTIKDFKDHIGRKVESNTSTLGQVNDQVKRDLGMMHKELNDMRQKLTGEISNLKEENHGFMRELQRNQQMTRELQQEFMKGLDEKKKVNQELLTTITQVKQPNQLTNDKSIVSILPNLINTTSNTNHEVTQRQAKLAKLFNDKKSVDYSSNSILNSMKKSVLYNLSFQISTNDDYVTRNGLNSTSLTSKNKTPTKERTQSLTQLKDDQKRQSILDEYNLASNIKYDKQKQIVTLIKGKEEVSVTQPDDFAKFHQSMGRELQM